jgi:hypothetical protein
VLNDLTTKSLGIDHAVVFTVHRYTFTVGESLIFASSEYLMTFICELQRTPWISTASSKASASKEILLEGKVMVYHLLDVKLKDFARLIGNCFTDGGNGWIVSGEMTSGEEVLSFGVKLIFCPKVESDGSMIILHSAVPLAVVPFRFITIPLISIAKP